MRITAEMCGSILVESGNATIEGVLVQEMDRRGKHGQVFG